VIRGLKELFNRGKKFCRKTGAENGYFGDSMVKILLPDEAKVIVDNIAKILVGISYRGCNTQDKQSCRGRR
jgi:hypothetical protein